MALLTQDVEEKVKEYLAAMDHEVTLEFYPRAGNAASDMVKDLWGEIAALSSKLTIKGHDDAVTLVAPDTTEDLESAVTELSVEGKATGIRYLGIPGGHEFGAFLETLVAVSKDETPEIGAEVAQYLKDVQSPLHLYVFVTPT